jgi:hypothetical protein
MRLGPPAVDHFRGYCSGRPGPRNYPKTWDRKSAALLSLALIYLLLTLPDETSSSTCQHCTHPSKTQKRSVPERPNMLFGPDRGTPPTPRPHPQARGYLSCLPFGCQSSPDLSMHPCHFLVRTIFRLLEKHRPTTKCHCMLLSSRPL